MVYILYILTLKDQHLRQWHASWEGAQYTKSVIADLPNLSPGHGSINCTKTKSALGIGSPDIDSIDSVLINCTTLALDTGSINCTTSSLGIRLYKLCSIRFQDSSTCQCRTNSTRTRQWHKNSTSRGVLTYPTSLFSNINAIDKDICKSMHF